MIVFLLQSFSHYSYIENRIGRYRVIPKSRSKVRLKKTAVIEVLLQSSRNDLFFVMDQCHMIINRLGFSVFSVS